MANEGPTSKKKLLFICSNMAVGGFQKSLINLLVYLDFENYDVTLYLVHKEGILLDFVDSRVKIITNEISDDYCNSYGISVKKLLSHKHYLLAVKRSVNLLISLIDKGSGAIFMSRQMPGIGGDYDVCVDYNGQYINYYMIDKITAKRKITYFHSDYSKWAYYLSSDKKYFQHVDKIVTVSDECVKALKFFFPEYSDKIIRIANIISEKTVKSMSNIQEDSAMDELPEKKWMLCTIGRICRDKGIDIAIEACSILKQIIGDNFLWVWVGPGEDNKHYKKLIFKYEIEENFILVGAKVNPYVYMDKADLIVHPSRFEGKAVAVEEALVMHKPIVVTRYSTVNNQVIDGVTGVIAEMNARCVAEKIIKLLNHPERLEEIRNNQIEQCNGNADEVNVFYEAIGM